MSCNSLPSATTILSEAEFEQIALDWLHGLGCTVKQGLDIAPKMPTTDRSGLFVLEQHLRRRTRPPHPHPPRRAGQQNRSPRHQALAAKPVYTIPSPHNAQPIAPDDPSALLPA